VERGAKLVSTGIEDLDRILGGKGYPDQSAILLISPPGAGKSELAYLFVKSGLKCEETTVCITYRAVGDMLNDMATFGVNKESPTHWIRCLGDSTKYNLSNLTNLFIEISKVINGLGSAPKRIYMDILSPLYMLHSAKIVYTFISNMLQFLKDHGATVVACLDEGVASLDAQRSMEMVFDGAIEIKLLEERFKILPLMRVTKMQSLSPTFSYYLLKISKAEVHFNDFNA